MRLIEQQAQHAEEVGPRLKKSLLQSGRPFWTVSQVKIRR